MSALLCGGLLEYAADGSGLLEVEPDVSIGCM